MSVPYPSPPEKQQGASVEPDQDQAQEQQSLGHLMGEVTKDMQKLFRQELALAKAELREEGSKAGKAAGMLSGAAFAGYMAAVLLSLTVVFWLSNLIGLGWSALVVAVLWAIAGAVLFVIGRKRLREVSAVPQQTVETVKEDAEWARHPTK